MLLRRINAQLEVKGLKVAASRGAILDATIIESAGRPDHHIKVDEQGQAQIVDSVDPEARWGQKGIVDLIQFEGSGEHPVHPLQTQMNKAIATLRYKVEQAFETRKRRFHLERARYLGSTKEPRPDGVSGAGQEAAEGTAQAAKRSLETGHKE